VTEILYFQGPLSTFLFHIPQKTYFFAHRFWWGTNIYYSLKCPCIVKMIGCMEEVLND